MSKKELANQNTGIAKAGFMSDDAGEGFENMDSDCYAVPMITMIQKMSPQVDEDKESYIPEAKPGMFFNSVTGELYESLEVICCSFYRAFTEWTRREEGGGFRGQHESSSERVQTATRTENELVTTDDTILFDTRYHYCLILKDGLPEPVLIPFKSTQVKKSKKWLSIMSNLVADNNGSIFKVPMFGAIYTLTSIGEQKDENTWKGFEIKMKNIIGEDQIDLYNAAKDFKESITSGKVVHAESNESIEDEDNSDM